MPITTPSMGLKRWNSPNDIFSYTELSDNFNLIDLHDHTSGKGVQVPTAGIANLAVTDTKIANDAVTAGKIAADAVTTAKILNANVTDAKLASPNSGVYRTVASVQNFATGLVTGTTYLMGGSALVASGTAAAQAPLLFPFNSAHYAVAGKTTALRLLVVGTTNTVAATSTFTFSLLALSSVAGGTAQITHTAGASISPTASYVAPAASTILSPVTTADFLPANGTYVLGVAISVASMAANSAANFSVELQMRHV